MYCQTKGNNKTMAQERRYKIIGLGSGLYVYDNLTGKKVYRGATYAACRSELYRLMGWKEPKHWKF